MPYQTFVPILTKAYIKYFADCQTFHYGHSLIAYD